MANSGNGARRPSRPGPQRRRGGFTLVELMVIIAVLGLLAGILMPYFARAFEIAHKTLCQRNLKGLADLLHASENPDMTVPTPDSWVGTVLGRGGQDILHCVNDYEEPSPFDDGLEAMQDMYILQYHTNSTSNHDESFLTSVLGMGGPAISDPQIWAWYPAGGVMDQPKGESWPDNFLPQLEENQAFVGVDNDSAILITFGMDQLKIECWKPPHQQYSRHWLMKGAGTPVSPLPDGASPDDDDDKELLRMWSRDFQKIDPRSPFGIQVGGKSSYGMNGLIEDKKWGPGQLMLMDANETRIDVDTANLEDDLFHPDWGIIKARHMGKVNVNSVDGSVKSMTLDELEEALDRHFEDDRGLWDMQ